MACGGPVGEHGYYLGGEVTDDDVPEADNAAEPTSQSLEQDDLDRKANRAFIRAVKGGR